VYAGFERSGFPPAAPQTAACVRFTPTYTAQHRQSPIPQTAVCGRFTSTYTAQHRQSQFHRRQSVEGSRQPTPPSDDNPQSHRRQSVEGSRQPTPPSDDNPQSHRRQPVEGSRQPTPPSTDNPQSHQTVVCGRFTPTYTDNSNPTDPPLKVGNAFYFKGRLTGLPLSADLRAASTISITSTLNSALTMPSMG
jgi:hypothetical protein